LNVYLTFKYFLVKAILLMRALDNLFFLKKAVVRHALRKIKAEFTFVNEHLIFLPTRINYTFY
ncbi:hypothetical protein AAGY18_13290, partial [Staphylococcus aureus]